MRLESGKTRLSRLPGRGSVLIIRIRREAQGHRARICTPQPKPFEAQSVHSSDKLSSDHVVGVNRSSAGPRSRQGAEAPPAVLPSRNRPAQRHGSATSRQMQQRITVTLREARLDLRGETLKQFVGKLGLKLTLRPEAGKRPTASHLVNVPYTTKLALAWQWAKYRRKRRLLEIAHPPFSPTPTLYWAKRCCGC